jgi:hypothetical protein
MVEAGQPEQASDSRRSKAYTATWRRGLRLRRLQR